MKVTLVFVLLVIFHGSAVNGQEDADVIKATTQTLESLDVAIRQMLTNNPPFIGGFVRLAFHDCVGDSCDGCIDYDSEDNAGKINLKKEIERNYILICNFFYKWV